MQQLIEQTLKEMKTANKSNTSTSCITYLQSLCSQTDINVITSKDSDDRSFFKLAKQHIKNMLAMTDIRAATNWDDIYFWKLGNLKACLIELKKYQDFDNFMFVEYKQNHFIKVDNTLTTDDFATAVKKLDSSQSMNALMSIIVLSGCLKDSPMALMENNMKTTFLVHCSIDDDNAASQSLLEFTLECFEFLPFHLLLQVAEKVIMHTYFSEKFYFFLEYMFFIV